MGTKSAPLALALTLACAPAAQAACKLMKIAELPVTMEGTSPTVTAKINGVDVRFTADSGAFFSMLTPQAAARLGLKVEPAPFGMTIRGLGGEEQFGVARAKSFNLAGIEFHNADFIVTAPQLNGGTEGLIGDNLLSFGDVEFDLPDGVIRLFKPEGCGSNVNYAYWANPDSISSVPIDPARPPDNHILIHLQVNGRNETAYLDSGAPFSFISRRAASEAGVNVSGSAARAGWISGGIGRREFDTWVAPFQSLKIGNEELKNTHLVVGAPSLGDSDMLLGSDFLVSHRVYVANSERQMFFTYVGGPVFRLDQAPKAEGIAAEQAKAAAAAPPTDAPTDAAGFMRRGAAYMARKEWDPAIGDFTHASELTPQDPAPLVQRAKARWRNRQAVLAMADLDQALGLKPDDAEALELRGELRLASKDDTGARRDFDAAFKADPTTRLAVSAIYIDAGQFDRGVAILDDWIAANPKDVRRGEALNERCWARALWNRDLDKALADCNESARVRSHVSDVLDSRGLVELRIGTFDKAINDYDEALRLQPKNAWSLYGRGLAKLALGKTSEGEADIAAAAAIEPKLPERARQYGLSAPGAPAHQPAAAPASSPAGAAPAAPGP